MPGTLPPEKPSSTPEDDAAATVPTIRGPVEEAIEELTKAALVEDPSAESDPPEEKEDPTALIGTVISGRYRVDALIGQGGMGAVYRGEQTHLRKKVAIKVLRARVQKLPVIVARFEREAIAGAHIQHPNVVSATDFGQLEDGSYFLILEYIEGTPLKDVMEPGPLPAARALGIARQIASALAAVHGKGIVHRDVKPQNILIEPGDQVKLIDFGLAKVPVEHLSGKARPGAPKGAPFTLAGVIFGTFSYLAPEAAGGMEAVDERADLYALGIVLYEMLSRKHPFDARDSVLLFKQQQLDDPPPIHVRAPEVDVRPEVEAVVMRLIQRLKADRYGSATEVITAIDEALAALDRPAPAPEDPRARAPTPAAFAIADESTVMTAPRPAAPPAPAPRSDAPRVRAWMILVAALTAVLIAGALVLVLRRLYPPAPPPVASVAPPVSAPPPESAAPPASSAALEIDGFDVEAWRARLKKAAGGHDWVGGGKAIQAIAKLSPKLLSREGVRGDVIAVTAGLGFDDSSEAADQVFDLLTDGLGTDGLDLLFELGRGRGGTRAGRRAFDILSRPEVLARATPALQITYELYKSPCDAKRTLFERAASEGDQRTLIELQSLRSSKCGNKKDPCCFREDKALAEAIQKLRSRFGI